MWKERMVVLISNLVEYLRNIGHQKLKRPVHYQVNCAILICDVIPDGKTE